MEGEYPKYITLIKLKTLKGAKHPQEEKYPSDGSTVRDGLMWEFSLPKVGESFAILLSKMNASFITSEIKEIEKVNDNLIILTTLNSKYKLEIK